MRYRVRKNQREAKDLGRQMMTIGIAFICFKIVVSGKEGSAREEKNPIELTVATSNSNSDETEVLGYYCA